jgi:hypothetical protein
LIKRKTAIINARIAFVLKYKTIFRSKAPRRALFSSPTTTHDEIKSLNPYANKFTIKARHEKLVLFCIFSKLLNSGINQSVIA